jgi:nitroreductase
MLKDLLIRNRSYRRFAEDVRISASKLMEWVDNTRCCGSGRNLQSLKYLIIHDSETCSQLFPAFSWAGYLKDWGGPKEGERPAAYILVYHDKTISENHYFDEGIAVQSILLSAVEDGFGGCIIVSAKKSAVQEIVKQGDHLQLLCVIALGKPVEKVEIVPMQNNDYQYYRDENQVHYVPKRPLAELLLSTEIKNT